MQIEISIWWILLLVIPIGFWVWRRLSSDAQFFLTLCATAIGAALLLCTPIILIQYTRHEIHKHLNNEERDQLTIWEQLTLKKVPYSEIKKRMQQIELEKKEYLKS